MPEGPAEARKKAIERLTMEVGSDAEAKAARRAKQLPFGGRIDPMRHVREVEVVPALPRAGRAAQIAVPNVIAGQIAPPRVEIKQKFASVSHVEAAMRSKRTLDARGLPWRPEYVQRIAERWPDGVPYDQVDALADELVAPPAPPRSGLRLIDGGVA